MTPELEKHLSNLQTVAMQLELMAAALNGVIDYRSRAEISRCLLSCIEEMADELNKGLDMNELRKVEARA